MALAMALAASARGEGPHADEAEVRYAEAPAPGSQIVLELSAAAEPGTTYRWVQTEGPAAAIDDPNGPKLKVTIPHDARQLAFRLTLRNARGERSVRVVVPIRTATPPPDDPDLPRADAGGDRVALVGRRIALDGSRSTPPGVGCRWIQMAGPKVTQSREDRGVFSFVPAAPGVYRFALIVGAGNVLSRPDEVEVTVGQPPAPESASADATMAQAGSGPRAMEAVYGRATLDQVAGVLDAVAERCSLYSTFADLTAEMSRRLDAALPPDPQVRQAWAQGVFEPLTQRTTLDLLPAGLDLRQATGHHQALTPPQQDRLQAAIRTYANALRARPSTSR